MCYFASAGMLGKRLNSPLLTIDSAAQFCYCKVNAFYNIFLFFFFWLVLCVCLLGNGWLNLSGMMDKTKFRFRFLFMGLSRERLKTVL